MSNKPKLPPVAQAGDGTPEGEAIAVIKKTFSLGGVFIPMTDDEIFAYRLDLQKRTAPMPPDLEPQGAIVKMRRGKLVWRIPGKGGADLDRPPLGVAIARMEQRYKAEWNKIANKLNLVIKNSQGKGHTKAKGDKTRDAVLNLAGQGKRTDIIVKTLKEKGLKISLRHVQEIIKEGKEKTR